LGTPTEAGALAIEARSLAERLDMPGCANRIELAARWRR
jgi:hypothetical protein